MGKEAKMLFDDVLIGFEKQVQKLYKKRLLERWKVNDTIIIDIRGQLVQAKLIDASAKVIRIDAEMPLTLRENCMITFKENPSIQMVGTPVITDTELNQGFWNRMSLRVALNQNQFKKAS